MHVAGTRQQTVDLHGDDFPALSGSNPEPERRSRSPGATGGEAGAPPSSSSSVAAPREQQQRRPAEAEAAAMQHLGVAGLVAATRSQHPDVRAFANGIDVRDALALDKSFRACYPVFSPWAPEPALEDPSFVLPECYTATKVSSAVHIEKYDAETLLYIFYSMPGDRLQLLAATELYQRGWKYHRQDMVWCTQAGNAPRVADKDDDSGLVYWDINVWRSRRVAGGEPAPAEFLSREELRLDAVR